jgi:hypothetical protein
MYLSGWHTTMTSKVTDFSEVIKIAEAGLAEKQNYR